MDVDSEGEMTTNSLAGVNKPHFILIVAASLHVNPKQVYKVGLWDICDFVDHSNVCEV